MGKIMDQNKKYILLAVSGETPQIITETLFKLKDTGYNIHEIHVITTVRGKNNLLALLSDDPEKNVFLKMCSEYGWDPLTVEERNIHVFSDMNGGFLEDIRTDSDERCAANFIFKTTKDLMDLRYGEDDSEYYPIVASIAGGRKTMSYLMGSTMSILGRSDDELTHVLVDPKFERLDRTSPKFYYPTRESKILLNADNEKIDAKDAKIELSFIPFIKLGQILKESKRNPFKDGMQTAYSDAVDAINSELTLKPEDLQMWINYKECEITVTNTKTEKRFKIQLEANQMAFFRLLIDNLTVPGCVKKPSKESSVQAIFRYWLKLFSYTPFDRNWPGLGRFILKINGVIDKIEHSKCLSESEKERIDPTTAFWDVYQVVIDSWENYTDWANNTSPKRKVKRKGMGQDYYSSKKQNQLDYRNNEAAFRDAHAENWKKLQDGVNKAIISSGCGDAIAEMLRIRCLSENGYSIGLNDDQIMKAGYNALQFKKLDIPDDEIRL